MNIAELFTGRANPWPSSGAIRYSTGKLRSRRAITIRSASERFTRGSLAPCTTISAVLILSAEFSGERSFNHAWPAGVPGSAMRAYICFRPASQYAGMASSRVGRFDGPTMSTAARYTSGVNATPASTAYPPYDPPRIPTRLGSAMPSATRYLTPQVRSSCILRPHSPLPALRYFLPYPVDPRKFGISTA